MNNYFFTVIKHEDEKHKVNYLVFDSFNVCLGCLSNFELAYDLISSYLTYLKEIYERMNINSVSDQISKLKKSNTDSKIKDLLYVDEFIISLHKSNEYNNAPLLPTYNLNDDIIFKTNQILISDNFKILLQGNDISTVHLKLVNDYLNKNSDIIENSHNELKSIFQKELSEEQIGIYFPTLNNEKLSEGINEKHNKKYSR
ncbi:hypothetical protein [Photorhabdus laumondii]|uniref:hypothetical protein n=1 Tax=Photorhabdus laumondii TaxID=2218628 RepID=UPI0025B00BE6|nr:hypothetical protein [Photorhabdus laumondii]